MPRHILLCTPGRAGVSRIVLGRGTLARLGSLARAATHARRIAIVTDTNVAALYLARARASLVRAGFDVDSVVVPAGERSKSPRVLARLWSALAAMGLERGDAIAALGGGVVGDLAGFTAASWMRGIEWIGVPTSLMAQVDSSIGGKTGIDLAEGKNLVGAFHQPRLVVIDPEALATLPERERRAGLAEVVKCGVIADRALFAWLERHVPRLEALDLAAYEEAVWRSVRAKARIVRTDERERADGPRTALNFGHTTGHAIERVLDYRRLRHGEAVAIGMRVAVALSLAHARLAPRHGRRITALLDALGLPRRIPALSTRALLAAMEQDKKRRNRRNRWVLTPQIGHASVPRLIPRRRVMAALKEVGART